MISVDELLTKVIAAYGGEENLRKHKSSLMTIDVKAGADFYDVLNWKGNYKTLTVKRIGKVGDEDAYVLEKRGDTGTPVIDYISTKTFLLLRRDSVIVSETAGIELPQTQLFSDYRNVDGVMISFKSVSNNIAQGETVVRITDVKWDVDIPDSVFKKPVSVLH